MWPVTSCFPGVTESLEGPSVVAGSCHWEPQQPLQPVLSTKLRPGSWGAVGVQTAHSVLLCAPRSRGQGLQTPIKGWRASVFGSKSHMAPVTPSHFATTAGSRHRGHEGPSISAPMKLGSRSRKSESHVMFTCREQSSLWIFFNHLKI